MHDLDRIQMESFEYEFESEGVFGEAETNALAAELLEVSSEAELEQFLGSLIKKAGGAIGSFIKGPAGQALGGILKNAAKQALPSVGGALGGLIGGDTGAQIGSKLGSFASSKIGNEMEYEAAKGFVKMTADAVKRVAAAPAAANPVAMAKAAVAEAARTHLPTLGSGSAAAGAGAREGRWFRRGNRIVLLGV